MKFNKYDAPVLAMIKAMNNHVGEDVDLITIRDEWYFNMKHKEDNKFVYWLDMTMEIVNKDVKIVYKRLPGWYTEVKFFIERKIEMDDG